MISILLIDDEKNKPHNKTLNNVISKNSQQFRSVQ